MSKRTLTEREEQIVAMVTDGKTNIEIAGELGCAVNTVSTHIQAIYNKTGVDNRVQLARWYLAQTAGAA